MQQPAIPQGLTGCVVFTPGRKCSNRVAIHDGTRLQQTSRPSSDGAPLGEFGVSIVWFGEDGRQESSGSFGAPRENAGNPERLKGKYANPATSGLASVAIHEGIHEQFISANSNFAVIGGFVSASGAETFNSLC